MESRIITGAIVVAIVVAVTISGGCMEKSEVEVDDVKQVQGYADPIAEQILVAMNKNDYAKYSEDFDQTMKNAMTEAVFDKANAASRSMFGDYVSKEFWKVESKEQHTIVYYKAKFTNDPDVIVEVTFKKIDGKMKVTGLWLGLPKLSTAEVAQVQGYADPIAEQILMAINTNDYAKYTEDYDQAMKSAMTEAAFDEANAALRSKIGDYVSKEFWKVENKDPDMIVYYKAKFTDDPVDVIVEVVFQKIDGKMKVAGLRYYSSKLYKP